MVGGNFTRGFAARKFLGGPRGNIAAPPPLARSRIPPATQAKTVFTNSNCKLFWGLELTSYMQAEDDS